MPKHKPKSKISNIKRRKIEKKNRSRDNAFGFIKTKKVKEYEGFMSDEESDTNPPPHHDQEVIVVSKDTFAHQPKPKSFHQLSQVSMTNLVSSIDTSLNEPDVGFFIDTTPTKPKRSKKILKDDSIYIESDDDDDDGISISSSEDIDILQALSHWGSNTDLQFDQSVKVKGRSDRDDIALLQNTFMEDICESSEEQEEKDIDMIEDDIDNVPDSLKHSYRIMVKQEISEWKRQHTQKKKKTVSTMHLLDQILHDFIDQDQVQTYSLGHLTHHGRTMIVPILAKLFQLEVTPMDTSQKHIMLTKTVHTSIPSFYTESTHKKKKTRQKKEWHGQQVASDSAPIPSSNIGHRMLSAMGWKEGEGINKDGIKEPVKVFMRANRKGLGAS